MIFPALYNFKLLSTMTSTAVNNNMGSDSCPAPLKNLVMFKIINGETVWNVILSSDSKEEKAIYWTGTVSDDAKHTIMRNATACAFMEQFAYSSGYDKDGFRAQFQVRSKTGDYFYNFHYASNGVMYLYKVGTDSDVDEEILVSSGYGGEWIKILSAVM